MSSFITPVLTTSPNFFCTLSNPKSSSRQFYINPPPNSKLHRNPPKPSVRASFSVPRRRRNSLRPKLPKLTQSPQLSENCNDTPSESCGPGVDEAEIARMARERAWSFEEDAADVAVVQEENVASLGLVSQQGAIFRGFPRIGIFMALCGACVYWAVERVFTKEESVEMKREELEMLRRKKETRMKRERFEKVSVEVEAMPEKNIIRPKLDRNEILRSIEKVRMESQDFGQSSEKTVDFDDRVREIREMARRAREIEQQNQNVEENEKDYVDVVLEENPSDTFSTNSDMVKNEEIVEENVVGVENGKNVVVANTERAMDMEVGMDIENGKMVGVANKEHAEDKTQIKNMVGIANKEHDSVKHSVDIQSGKLIKEDANDCGNTIPDMSSMVSSNSGHETGNKENVVSKFSSLSPITNAVGDKEGKENKTKKTNLKKASINEMAPASGFGSKSKPKLIKSVKQAREYLAEKNGASANEMQPKQVKKPKRSSLRKNARARPYDGKPGDSTIANAGSVARKESQVDYVSRIEINEGKSEQALGDHDTVDKIEKDNVVHSSKSLLGHNAENTDSQTSKLNDSSDEQNNTDNQKDIYASQASEKEISGTRDNGGYFSHEIDDLTNKRHLDSKVQVKKSENGFGDRNITLNDSNNGFLIDTSSSPADVNISRDLEPISNVSHDSDAKHGTGDLPKSETNFEHKSDGSDCKTEPSSSKAEKSWLEENFEQLDPVIKKIGAGFTESYMIAKEKVRDQSSLSTEISEIRSLVEEEELEWMKDVKLSEIVFKVRDNELAGRDPFHMMNVDEQHAFFKGLERKAEKVNEQLQGVHEYLHSRIENLDYGADGISMYDPPEKIIPRWKSPAIAKDPEFLNKRAANKKVKPNKDVQTNLQKSEVLPNSSITPSSLPNQKISNRTPKSSKTLIECSDGSFRPGKKNGKEHWEHTKKWSQGFLDVYNAETDPEIKSVMKDIGKDLDRWSTVKDLEDTADLMTNLPKKKRRYIEKKMEKLKKELEMYGSQAVINKYKEYSDEKEEDYLWWLDLQFVLCIELYTVENDIARVGFYSLEMAAELELDPKQHHVIAFEDPGDCKSFCYIIQAQMDLLGNGRAFVVARPPKDAFRDAKANGFSVTVIRKGEVKLNVDQTLDEVEENLVEIGSKIYHDKIMHERGVDIRTLTKGVINADRATNKKSKKILEGPGKSKRL